MNTIHSTHGIMGGSTCAKAPSIYKPRRPEKSVLHQIIRKSYQTWKTAGDLPCAHHIDQEFQDYLQCGILANGCAHAHCEGCDREFLIAFSCKGRGICPS